MKNIDIKSFLAVILLLSGCRQTGRYLMDGTGLHILDTATGDLYKLPDGEMLLNADGNGYTKTNWIKVLEIK